MSESTEKDILGYVAGPSSKEEDTLFNNKYSLALKEAFKGEKHDTEVRFPKELGAEHPFDFEQIEKIVDNIGLVNSAVDKITDSVIGDFTVKVKNNNSQTIIDDFVDNSNFMSHIRKWVKEGISKGNGFMNLTNIQKNEIRTENSNNMYVKRTKKQKIIEYNQFVGNTNRVSLGSYGKKVVNFKPNEIAHLKINANPGEPYGQGLLNQNKRTINNYTSAELDLHKLIARKAGVPYHIKVGVPGQSTRPESVDNVKEKLQYQNNRTEWATDANVDISVLDFKDVGKNLTEASNHDVEQFAIGMQIPMVMMGIANIPEGLAKEQTESYQRFINSLRVVIGEIIENKILRPLLRTNKLDEKIEFIWEFPGEKVKDERINRLNEALKNPFLSPILRAALEQELAETLDLQEVLKLLPTPQEAEDRAEEDRQRQEEENIQQPEVPGAKPTANQSEKTTIKERCNHPECNLTEQQLNDMPVSEYVNITEMAGFNYSDYLVKILTKLKTYKFEELLALTEQDLVEGLLPKNDIEKLRVILKDGFRKNKTIKQIEKDIASGIELQDRLKIDEDGAKKLTLSKERRPNVIARTETVRLANQGLKDLYMENDILSYRYLAALDERTSDICMELNGQVFLVQDGMPGVNMPPMHVNCRSTIVGLVD